MVHAYTVRYNSTPSDVAEVVFPTSASYGRLSNLQPGTTYQFNLDIDNGAHIVTSRSVFATTDDGGGLNVEQIYYGMLSNMS